jgi:hypothetical protein
VTNRVTNAGSGQPVIAHLRLVEQGTPRQLL